MPAAYADIMTGETNVADICFLVALILGALAAIICIQDKAWVGVLMGAAVAFVAFGLLAL